MSQAGHPIKNHKRITTMESNECSTPGNSNHLKEDIISPRPSKRARPTNHTNPCVEKDIESATVVSRSIRVECQIGSCSMLYTHQERLPPSILTRFRQPLYICHPVAKITIACTVISTTIPFPNRILILPSRP